MKPHPNYPTRSNPGRALWALLAVFISWTLLTGGQAFTQGFTDAYSCAEQNRQGNPGIGFRSCTPEQLANYRNQPSPQPAEVATP
jgi:hypothetical protein